MIKITLKVGDWVKVVLAPELSISSKNRFLGTIQRVIDIRPKYSYRYILSGGAYAWKRKELKKITDKEALAHIIAEG